MKVSLNTKRAASWTLLGIWTVLLCVCSLLHAAAAADALSLSGSWLEKAALALGLSGQTAGALQGYTPYILQVAGYMLLGLLTWNALRLHLGRNSSLALALAASSLVAVLNEMSQIAIPGRIPRVTDWLLDMAGAFVLLAGIRMFQWMWKRFPRLVNRETVSYVVFGVLTTVVNIVTFQICFLAFPFSEVANNIAANTLAWVLSVLFAYVVNKLFVFQSRTVGAKALLGEAGKFIGARVFSYAVDMAGMLLLVNLLQVHSGLSKIGMNVIVMIMNYFFSKWFIFKEVKKPAADSEQTE